MNHGAELSIAFTVCTVLVVGVALKMLCERIKVPYTIALLLLGLATGAALAMAPAGGTLNHWFVLFAKGNEVGPDLILFVFLPILVFESAFALEVHTLRKNIGPVLFFAGPALIASTAGIAALMVGLTSSSWQWTWLPALTFGALISATDPVAVVALLRDLGAPKRLGVLLEGESLLNDGTAIVVFGLLLGMLTGEADATVGGVILRFVVVAGGGTLVGLALGWLTSTWLTRTFNQPVVEITLTLALAYLSMVLAEGVLHVSGVIAVVVAGVWMSGPGRPSISPEVHHFLHRFWEMLAYVANTLIFFLVGLVVTTQVTHLALSDLLIVLAAFLGILVVRLAIFLVSKPVVGWLADPIETGEAVVLSWGGLRGAVSLALALIVGQSPAIPEVLRGQIFLLTASLVILTILVNGSTMAVLLRKLGYNKAPPTERLAHLTTRASVLEQVRDKLDGYRKNPELRAVNWSDVEQQLNERRERLAAEMVAVRSELTELGDEQREIGYWRQVLSVERTAYWNALAKGTLPKVAVLLIDHEIDLQLDELTHDRLAPPRSRINVQAGVRARVRALLDAGGTGRVALRYDLCRAQHLGACAVLDELAHLDMDPDIRANIEDHYRGYRHEATEQLEDLRVNLPELTRAVETRIARRIELNLEREVTSDLEHKGVLSPEDAAAATGDVEQRMKRLLTSRHAADVPKAAELCREAPLFAGLDDEAITHLAALTTERVLAPDEVLFEMGSRGGNVFVIARGAAAVVHETETESRLLDVLGTGDVLGEMELLTGAPRSATIRALTTLTLSEISREAFEGLMAREPAFATGIWSAFAVRRFDNHLHALDDYAHLGRDERVEWASLGRLETVEDGADVVCTAGCLFVFKGELVGHAHHAAPALVHPAAGEPLKASGQTHLLHLPPSPPGESRRPQSLGAGS